VVFAHLTGWIDFDPLRFEFVRAVALDSALGRRSLEVGQSLTHLLRPLLWVRSWPPRAIIFRLSPGTDWHILCNRHSDAIVLNELLGAMRGK